MSNPVTLSLIETSTAAWKARDAAYIPRVFHPELVYEDVPLAKVMRGLDEFEAFFTLNTEAFPDIEMALLAAVADETHGGAEWILSGTFLVGNADLGPATGRRFEIRGASVFAFKNRLIVGVRDYFDGPSFTDQLGLDPQG